MAEPTEQKPVVDIRPGRREDMARVHQAIRSLADHIGAPDHVLSSPDDLTHHAFGDTPVLFVEIAEVDGAFAGMCLHFPIFSTWLGKPGVFVQDIYVEQAFRGHKVGEALLRHVAKKSRAKGGAYLRLSVDVDNLGAQAFYNKLGITHSEYEQIHKVMGEAFFAFCDGRRPPLPGEEW